MYDMENEVEIVIDRKKIDYINRSINNLYNHYGISKFSRDETIADSVIKVLESDLRRDLGGFKVNVIGVDDKEYSVNVTDKVINELIYYRDKSGIKKFTLDDYRNVLCQCAPKYMISNLEYYGNNETKETFPLLYTSLGCDSYDILVGKMLMKYKCSSFVFDLIADDVSKINGFYGVISDVMNRVITKENTINKKKYVICTTEMEKEFKYGIRLNVDSERFAFDYITRSIVDKYENLGMNMLRFTELSEKVYDLDISLNDVFFRRLSGMSEKEAIELGKKDKELYGYTYDGADFVGQAGGLLNFYSRIKNIRRYVTYMAKKEFHIKK